MSSDHLGLLCTKLVSLLHGHAAQSCCVHSLLGQNLISREDGKCSLPECCVVRACLRDMHTDSLSSHAFGASLTSPTKVLSNGNICGYIYCTSSVCVCVCVCVFMSAETVFCRVCVCVCVCVCVDRIMTIQFCKSRSGYVMAVAVNILRMSY